MRLPRIRLFTFFVEMKNHQGLLIITVFLERLLLQRTHLYVCGFCYFVIAACSG